MKRIGLLAVALALAVGLSTLAHAQDDSSRNYPPGPGYGMGPGMGYGGGYGMGPGLGYGGGWGHMGSGMMGGGWGMMGGGMGYGRMGWVLSQLPADKREQLRSFHFSMRRQMIAKVAEMQQARLDLQQAMQSYPLDRSAVEKAFDKVTKARREMFELRLTAMIQMQQIIGKELWEEMRSGGYGPGPGGPGAGPGMMRPGGGMSR
ncbi:MAG TPA: periplasmic heavy metal sensor [bacterium]|nr:periplasmic heavy metal sensor [bacterium]